MEASPASGRKGYSSQKSNLQMRSELCNVCQSIDIERYRHREMTRSIHLGSWRELVQSTKCPFCRLVVRGLSTHPGRLPRSLDDEIIMSNHLSWELGVELSPYDQLRSLSYSNKFDLRSMARKYKYSTYRFVVSAEHKPEESGYIQFVATREDIQADAGQFSGRHVDRSKVDIDLLRSWLERCANFHDDKCADDGTVSLRLPSSLRLIDVEKRCLVRAQSDRISYLTLSYVWGTEEMKRDTGMTPVITNRADLRTTDTGTECTPLPDRLPRTIEDAIFLTSRLGYRYIWVDALCIVQDDSYEDKKNHLERMDAVYNCSDLTIVAASGVHADTGLPGISVPRKKSQISERIRSCRLAPMSPSFTELENCRSLPWNTRGWTFQEKIFAKRLLLFTEFQVFFRCSESIWTEEAVMETETPSKSIEARPAKYRWAADRQPYLPSRKLLLLKSILPQFNVNDEWSYLGNFPDYAAAIREYSQRRLTNEEDKLIAIRGIFRSMESDAGRFIFGLPEKHLLQSLLWHPEPGSISVRENIESPSWAWASWCFDKGVVFDVLDIRVIRIILLLVRNTYCSVKKVASKMSRPSGSSTGGSSTNHSSGSCSSSADTSSSSTSSSTPMAPLAPLGYPAGSRDWTTLNAMGKAVVNVAACFSWPLLFRNHTVKNVFLYKNGSCHRLDCEEPLTISNFVKDEHTNNERVKSERAKAKDEKARINAYHSKTARRYTRPVLAMQSVVVQYHIGVCLRQPASEGNASVGCYELLDKRGLCVGEVWTTRKHALEGQTQALEFLTISWGLALTAARIANKYIPRWDFDATVLAKSRTNLVMKSCMIFEQIMSWTSQKHLSATYGVQNNGLVDQQPSLISFFECLLTAKKGKPRPKFMWSTVNMLLVERVSNHDRRDRDRVPVFRRAGTAKIIFEAWLASSSPSREVILE